MIDKLTKVVARDKIFKSELMSRHTTFKIGGPADYFIIVSTVDELKEIIKISKDENIPLYVIGNGSNVLIKDNGIRGIVIKLDMKGVKTFYTGDDAIVEVEAGLSNALFSKYLVDNELTGFEFAAGIPGTIGGSIRMNAGAFGGEFKDIVEEVTFLDMDDLKLYSYRDNMLNFSYRYSTFIDKKRAIIIKARFKLKKGKRSDIEARIAEISNERKTKQPIDKPSAGSTFRRVDGFITAKAIDESGFKGYKVGGAEVSTKHAGFIINNKNATAKDVLELVDIISNSIKEKYGVEIKPEIEIWGE